VYAKTGVSCSMFPPSLVNKQGCEDTIIASATSIPPVVDVETAAGEWSLAFENYWQGGLFGATGLVTAITGTSALETQLVSIWNAAAQSGGTVTSSQVAEQMAVALDAFTRTVMVKDTAFPVGPPPGCGPAPII